MIFERIEEALNGLTKDGHRVDRLIIGKDLASAEGVHATNLKFGETLLEVVYADGKQLSLEVTRVELVEI
jgi:hypothetical protein